MLEPVGSTIVLAPKPSSPTAYAPPRSRTAPQRFLHRRVASLIRIAPPPYIPTSVANPAGWVVATGIGVEPVKNSARQAAMARRKSSAYHLTLPVTTPGVAVSS